MRNNHYRPEWLSIGPPLHRRPAGCRRTARVRSPLQATATDDYRPVSATQQQLNHMVSHPTTCSTGNVRHTHTPTVLMDWPVLHANYFQATVYTLRFHSDTRYQRGTHSEWRWSELTSVTDTYVDIGRVRELKSEVVSLDQIQVVEYFVVELRG